MRGQDGLRSSSAVNSAASPPGAANSSRQAGDALAERFGRRESFCRDPPSRSARRPCRAADGSGRRRPRPSARRAGARDGARRTRRRRGPHRRFRVSSRGCRSRSTSDRCPPGARGTAPLPRAGGRARLRGPFAFSFHFASSRRFSASRRAAASFRRRAAASALRCSASSAAIFTSSVSILRLASAASAASRACARRPPGQQPTPARTRRTGPASAPGDLSSQRCFAAGPMCSDGGLSRRRCSSSASPASRARASCAAWLSAVTRSATPARPNARFISAAHACRVSSSHSRGFVRSLFLAPPDAGSRPAGAARRNHCSAARSTPSFTRSENTRCRCGLFCSHPRLLRQAGVHREGVGHLPRRHVRGEAARQLEPPRQVQRVGQRRGERAEQAGRCSARGCRPPPSTLARPTTRTPAWSPTRCAPPRPGRPWRTGRRG